MNGIHYFASESTPPPLPFFFKQCCFDLQPQWWPWWQGGENQIEDESENSRTKTVWNLIKSSAVSARYDGLGSVFPWLLRLQTFMLCCCKVPDTNYPSNWTFGWNGGTEKLQTSTDGWTWAKGTATAHDAKRQIDYLKLIEIVVQLILELGLE